VTDSPLVGHKMSGGRKSRYLVENLWEKGKSQLQVESSRKGIQSRRTVETESGGKRKDTTKPQLGIADPRREKPNQAIVDAGRRSCKPTKDRKKKNQEERGSLKGKKAGVVGGQELVPTREQDSERLSRKSGEAKIPRHGEKVVLSGTR